jgi:hypothetical protein
MGSDRLPLTMMDAAIVSQTMPGRPMTTHHVLEFGAAISRPALERAVEHLAAAFPQLRARALEGFWRWERTVDAPDPARARAQLTVVAQPGFLEESSWVQTPFAVGTEWPFRVRYGPTPRGTFTLCFTLHHSVTDGHGALVLFDALLNAALAAEAGRPLLAPEPVPAPAAPWRTIVSKGPGFLLAVALAALKSMPLIWHHRAVLLDAPRAPIEGFGVKVLPLSAQAWLNLKARATELGCTRNDLLCAAALKAVAAVRRGRAEQELPLRMLGVADLRTFFNAPGPQSNWMGTLEVDISPAELAGPELERLLHARLVAGRDTVPALATPVLLGVLGALLPVAAFRELFRRIDAPGPHHPFSILVSHIRPPGELCWPEALQPRALWCASTLPRKPGLGLTITTVGDNVTIAACWPVPLVREETIDALLAELGRALGDDERVAASISA